MATSPLLHHPAYCNSDLQLDMDICHRYDSHMVNKRFNSNESERLLRNGPFAIPFDGRLK